MGGVTGRRKARTGSGFEIPKLRVEGISKLLAIDPGTRHCGMALLERRGAGDWKVTETMDLGPVACLQYTSLWVAKASRAALVLEGYQLFPTMLQEQGLSRMGTPEVIGALKWEYLRLDRPLVALYEQGASVKQRGCAYLNELHGGLCRYEHKGGKRVWSHDTEVHTGSNIHKRDAEAHGWYRARKITEGVLT